MPNDQVLSHINYCSSKKKPYKLWHVVDALLILNKMFQLQV